METRIEARDLIGVGLTEKETQAVLSCASSEERIHLLRCGRSRILEDIHARQKALDRLDYFIYRLRNGNA